MNNSADQWVDLAHSQVLPRTSKEMFSEGAAGDRDSDVFNGVHEPWVRVCFCY